MTFAGAFEHDTDPLALADMLMYDAKDNGRDQYAMLDDEHCRAPRSGARMAWRSRIDGHSRRTCSSCTCSRFWTSEPTRSRAPRR